MQGFANFAPGTYRQRKSAVQVIRSPFSSPLLSITERVPVSSVYRYNQWRNMKHGCLIVESSICSEQLTALFYSVIWRSSELVFCLTPDRQAVKRRPECGGVERWRAGGGGDSEQPSFCLQFLNSCTAKVHCIKSQRGGAARQLRSRRTKEACCLRKHASRRTSDLRTKTKHHKRRTEKHQTCFWSCLL